MPPSNPFFQEDFNKLFAVVFDALVQKQLTEVREAALGVVANNLESLAKGISPFLERMDILSKETDAASLVIGGHVKSAGFWIPPSVSLSFIVRLRGLCSHPEVTPKLVRHYFLDAFGNQDFELLRYAIDLWAERRHFDVRTKVINSALEAHTKGQYELSIPALLPVIEGVLTGIAGRPRDRSERMADYAQLLLSKEYSDSMQEASKEALVSFVTGSTLYGPIPREYFKPHSFKEWLTMNGLEEDQVLNRHAILHGVQLNYASPENSLRAFLLLDALSMIDPIRFLGRNDET